MIFQQAEITLGAFLNERLPGWAGPRKGRRTRLIHVRTLKRGIFGKRYVYTPVCYVGLLDDGNYEVTVINWELFYSSVVPVLQAYETVKEYTQFIVRPPLTDGGLYPRSKSSSATMKKLLRNF